MITVDWRELGIPPDAKPFADGAIGELFLVPNQLPALPGRRLVFKRVKEKFADNITVDRKDVLAQMRSAVGLRDGLSPAELADLDEVTVWPLAMVSGKGKDVGTLMDLIADEFSVDTKPAGHPPGRKLFELQFLCVSQGYFTATGIDPSVTGDEVMRLALAARLAYAIEIVHRHPVVFGDLHLKNAVAATKPIARVLLMDCDGVAELSNTSRIQLHGPGFVPPEIGHKHQKLQDQVTDVYKLGLCVIKALSPGAGSTQLTDPARIPAGMLDAQGVALLQRAVGPNRDDRPKASDLRDYLVRRVLSLIQPPVLISAELSHRVVLRGSDVFVRWQQLHGTEVRIFGANGFTLEGIDPDRFANGYAIRPPAGGPIEVEVWNKHGPSVRLTAGCFDYYELPEIDIAGQLREIPWPEIPHVPRLEAGVFESLQPYPMSSLPDLKVEFSAPTLAYPPLSLELGAQADQRGDGPSGVLGQIHRSANEMLARSIRDAMKRMRTVTRQDSPNDKQPRPPGS